MIERNERGAVLARYHPAAREILALVARVTGPRGWGGCDRLAGRREDVVLLPRLLAKRGRWGERVYRRELANLLRDELLLAAAGPGRARRIRPGPPEAFATVAERLGVPIACRSRADQLPTQAYIPQAVKPAPAPNVLTKEQSFSLRSKDRGAAGAAVSAPPKGKARSSPQRFPVEDPALEREIAACTWRLWIGGCRDAYAIVRSALVRGADPDRLGVLLRDATAPGREEPIENAGAWLHAAIPKACGVRWGSPPTRRSPPAPPVEPQTAPAFVRSEERRFAADRAADPDAAARTVATVKALVAGTA